VQGDFRIEGWEGRDGDIQVRGIQVIRQLVMEEPPYEVG